MDVYGVMWRTIHNIVCTVYLSLTLAFLKF